MPGYTFGDGQTLHQIQRLCTVKYSDKILSVVFLERVLGIHRSFVQQGKFVVLNRLGEVEHIRQLVIAVTGIVNLQSDLLVVQSLRKTEAEEFRLGTTLGRADTVLEVVLQSRHSVLNRSRQRSIVSAESLAVMHIGTQRGDGVNGKILLAVHHRYQFLARLIQIERSAVDRLLQKFVVVQSETLGRHDQAVVRSAAEGICIISERAELMLKAVIYGQVSLTVIELDRRILLEQEIVHGVNLCEVVLPRLVCCQRYIRI